MQPRRVAGGTDIPQRSTRAGGYHVAFAYDAKTVLRRPLRQMWGLCYFDLWGRIGLSYDHERDVLTLAGYGDYYRAEE